MPQGSFLLPISHTKSPIIFKLVVALLLVNGSVYIKDTAVCLTLVLKDMGQNLYAKTAAHAKWIVTGLDVTSWYTTKVYKTLLYNVI